MSPSLKPRLHFNSFQRADSQHLPVTLMRCCKIFCSPDLFLRPLRFSHLSAPFTCTLRFSSSSSRENLTGGGERGNKFFNFFDERKIFTQQQWKLFVRSSHWRSKNLRGGGSSLRDCRNGIYCANKSEWWWGAVEFLELVRIVTFSSAFVSSSWFKCLLFLLKFDAFNSSVISTISSRLEFTE